MKDIITVAFNSLEVEKTTDNNNNNTVFTINTPPIIIRNKAILKVSNFCHIGNATGHADNMYLFRIRGVIADTSRFFTGSGGGNPLILTTTFNNNRSLYDENVITLVKQTINAIDILVDTYLPYATIAKNLSVITNGTYTYFTGQTLELTIASTNYNIRVDSVNSSGNITSFSFPNNDAPTTQYTTTSSLPTFSLTNNTNGSGASLTAVLTSGAISSITINNGGVGYRVGQTLAFSGGGGSGANISIASIGTLGDITGFTITSGGSSYTTPPTISINTRPINNGYGANISLTWNAGGISTAIISSGGFGYKVGQTLQLATNVGSGGVVRINNVNANGTIINPNGLVVDNPGSYSTAPAVLGVNPTNDVQATFNITSFGQVLKESIPNSLNFSITFIIEQDINE